MRPCAASLRDDDADLTPAALRSPRRTGTRNAKRKLPMVLASDGTDHQVLCADVHGGRWELAGTGEIPGVGEVPRVSASSACAITVSRIDSTAASSPARSPRARSGIVAACRFSEMLLTCRGQELMVT